MFCVYECLCGFAVFVWFFLGFFLFVFLFFVGGVYFPIDTGLKLLNWYLSSFSTKSLERNDVSIYKNMNFFCRFEFNLRV